MHQHLYQRGNGFDLPVYRTQMRGAGFGSILKSIVKFVMPFAKPLLKKVIPVLKKTAISGIKQYRRSSNPSIKNILKKEAIKTGTSLLSNVLSGTSNQNTVKKKTKGKKRKKKQPGFVTNKKPKLSARKWP